jgi:hypothetical protein
MDKQGKQGEQIAKKPNFLTRLTLTCSAPLTQVALSAISAWLLVTGLKGLAGFPVNQTTAAADLIGIIIVIGGARWFKSRSDAK